MGHINGLTGHPSGGRTAVEVLKAEALREAGVC